MIAEVRLWGRTIGAVSMEDGRDYATFQFTPEFADSGIQVSPVTMPLSRQSYEFPSCHAHVPRSSRACWRTLFPIVSATRSSTHGSPQRDAAPRASAHRATLLHRNPRHGSAGIRPRLGTKPRQGDADQRRCPRQTRFRGAHPSPESRGALLRTIPRQGPCGHPESRHLRGRCPRKGRDRVESADQTRCGPASSRLAPASPTGC